MQVQDSQHKLLHTMYIWKDIMLVSHNSEHNGVCRCNLLLVSLTNNIYPSLTAALSDLPGNEHGKIVAAEPPALLADGKLEETKNHRRNELRAFVAKCMNEYANQHGTGVDFSRYTMPRSAHIFKLQSVKLQYPKCTTVPFNKCIPDSRRSCKSACGD